MEKTHSTDTPVCIAISRLRRADKDEEELDRYLLENWDLLTKVERKTLKTVDVYPDPPPKKERRARSHNSKKSLSVQNRRRSSRG